MSKVDNDSSMSASKKKRVEREKKYTSEKRKKNLIRGIWMGLGAVVVIVLAFFLIRGLYKSITKVKPSSDYSAGLNENGFIDGVRAADYAKIPDYKNFVIPKADVEYSDEDVQKDIDSVLEEHKELNEDTALEVKDGDTVSIDYVGTIDGVEFEGGNSNGAGHDLEIGSGSFIDDFETQLVGSHPGDSVTVQVTFPDDYSNAELQGKDAEFAVDIHGIYEKPEFTDDFVAENLSENASTVEEYKKYLKDTHYDENLENALREKLTSETEVTKYPKYLKQAKSVKKYLDEQSFEQLNEMYKSYYGSGFTSFSEYTGMTEDEYEESLDEEVKGQLKNKLAYQGVLEGEGVTLSEQDYRDYLTEINGDDTNYDTDVEQYGLPYLLNDSVLERKALELLKNYVKVE